MLQQLSRLAQFEDPPQGSIAFSGECTGGHASTLDLAAGGEKDLKNGSTFRGEDAGENFYLMI